MTERAARVLRGTLLAALLLVLGGAALWGLDAPFAWGHVGFHGAFHGSAARNLERHGAVLPTPWVSQSPPPPHARYLHHPLVVPPTLAAVRVVAGEAEWGARLVPVLFTLVTLLALLWVVRRWWGPWHALGAGAVFVLLPHTLVFCHLIDHETPGMLFALLGVVGALEALRERGSGGSRRRWMLLAGVGFGLAALTDWPPYFIGLALAFALLGLLLAHRGGSSPGRAAGWVGAGLVAALAVVLALAGWGVGWPLGRGLAVAGALAVVAALGAALSPRPIAGPIPRPSDGPIPQPPASPTFRFATPAWRPWLALVGVGLLLVAVGAAHLALAKASGLGADLALAARYRGEHAGSGGLGKLLGFVVHTYTLPVVLLGGAWLLSLPLRVAHGRLDGRSLLPAVFFAGQWIHNVAFPGEVEVHIYRTYYFTLAFATAAVDLGGALAALLRWALAELDLRGPALRRATAAAVAVLCAAVLVAEARAAWPVLVEGRHRSGTLRFGADYRHELEKVALFRWLGRQVPRQGLVLYTYDLTPRLESLWYLDRDHEVLFSVPDSAPGALRAANWTIRFRADTLKRAEPLLDPARHGHRPLWLVVTLRSGCAHPETLASLARRYPVTRLGPWWVVELSGSGPRPRALGLVATRPRGALGRLLAGPLPDFRLAPGTVGAWGDPRWIAADCRRPPW